MEIRWRSVMSVEDKILQKIDKFMELWRKSARDYAKKSPKFSGLC